MVLTDNFVFDTKVGVVQTVRELFTAANQHSVRCSDQDLRSWCRILKAIDRELEPYNENFLEDLKKVRVDYQGVPGGASDKDRLQNQEDFEISLDRYERVLRKIFSKSS